MNRTSKVMVAVIAFSTSILILDLFDVFDSKELRLVCYGVLCIAAISFFFISKRDTDSRK